MEEYAYVLDYLPRGLPDRKFNHEPLAYALGELEFKLFELVPKKDAPINMGDRVYIGKEIEKREVITHVKRRIGFEELTNTGQSELPFIIEEIVKSDESRFIRFYNDAQAISTRFHMLELLPGLGKKTMWGIIDERRKGVFKDFKDLEKRVSAMHHPLKPIIKRIENELAEPDQKYHVFVAK